MNLWYFFPVSMFFPSLFRQFILRNFLHEKIRSLVTALGVALGVAVVVAVQLANQSAVRGFAAAVEAISGRASLEIVGSGPGFDELLLRQMNWLRRYGELSPIIEGDAAVQIPGRTGELVRVLGVDILRDRRFRDYHLVELEGQGRSSSTQEFLDRLLDSQSILLTRKLANRLGLSLGSQVELLIGDRSRQFTLRGLLLDAGPARALDGNFALMDIATAQLAFERLGRLDRLDILVGEGMDLQRLENSLESLLPEGLVLQRPQDRGRQAEKMLQSFHFNLTALSHISLLVGLFLIYNTVSISVIARRQEIGCLRAIGVTRATILGLFLAQAAVLAVAGCSMGLLLGRFLAEGAVRLTSTTVEILYVATAAKTVPLSSQQVFLAFALGLTLSLLAAAIPALEASWVPPAAVVRHAGPLKVFFRPRLWNYYLPPFMFLCAAGLSTLPPLAGLPVFGYLAALAAVFGAAFAVPPLLYGLGKIGSSPLGRLFGVEGWLANANLKGSVPRLSISVAALALSLSMLVAIAIMIGSFRETVIYWVGQTLKADLYLRPALRTNVSLEATISPEVERTVRAHPAVSAVDRFRNFSVPYEGSRITLGAGEFSVLLDHGNLLFKAPSDGRKALREAIARDQAVVSESFALKYGKRIGDWIDLPTPKGMEAFQVAAIYYDYSSDRGVVVMDRSCLTRYFGDLRPTSMSLYLNPGADPSIVRQELLSSLGAKHRLFLETNVALRREVLRIFDSTFAITYALEAIAVVVAILGVASTLLTLILERRLDLQMLRQLGTSRRQVRKMVLIEAILLGFASQAAGLVVGVLLSLVLIYVINVQSFGWTIQFHLPLRFLVQSSLMVLAAAALAGLYPAHRACQLPAVENGNAE